MDKNNLHPWRFALRILGGAASVLIGSGLLLLLAASLVWTVVNGYFPDGGEKLEIVAMAAFGCALAWVGGRTLRRAFKPEPPPSKPATSALRAMVANPKRRLTLLVLALGLAALTWLETSVSSPAYGSINGRIDAAFLWAYRRAARAPCEECPLASFPLGGLTITYPAILKAVKDSPHESLDSATFQSRNGWLHVIVVPIKPGHEAKIRDSYRRRLVGARQRIINGWSVYTHGVRGWSLADTTIFGEHRVINVSALVDDRLAESELGRWWERTVDTTVTKLCEDHGATFGANDTGTRAIDRAPTPADSEHSQ